MEGQRLLGLRLCGGPQHDHTPPFGFRETIAQLGVDDSRKTLGIYTCTSGNSAAQLLAMEKKVRKWSSRLLNSRFPTKWACVSYNLQLWTSLRYGLGTLSTPLCELGTAFPLFAQTILPRLGINRNRSANAATFTLVTVAWVCSPFP